MKRIVLFAAAASVLLSGCTDKVSKIAGSAEKIMAERTAEVKSKLRHERPTDPVCVKVMKVAYSDNVAASILVGSIEPAKSSVVSSQYPGTLKHIAVHKGQTVKAGTVIAEIDAQNVKSAYDASLAVYDQAKDALKRVERVYMTGSVSEVKLVEVRTAFAKAKASLRSAEKALGDCRIKAPYSGVVGEIYPHEGMELPVLAPVIQLLDVSSVEVHAAVPENEYAIYPAGLPVRIEVPAIDRTLDGVLAVKGVDASKVSRSYDCTFKFSDASEAEGIMPGMICKVHMTGACRNAIVIPASAVLVDGEGRYVWCCNDGVVEKKHVVSGGFSKNGVIVTEGLQPGDLLVIEGSRKISSGMKGIRVIE